MLGSQAGRLRPRPGHNNKGLGCVHRQPRGAGVRNGVVCETAGGTGEETEGSCCQIVPRCHVDEAAGSPSGLAGRGLAKDGSREAGLQTRPSSPAEGVLTPETPEQGPESTQGRREWRG